MPYISGKAIRAQVKKLVSKLTELFSEFGYNSEIELVPQVGTIYIFNVLEDGKVIKRSVGELQLQFNPLDVDMVTTKKYLRKEARVTSIEKRDNSYIFKCS